MQVCDPYSGYVQPNEIVGANNTNELYGQSTPSNGSYAFSLSHPTQGYNLIFDCAGEYQITFDYMTMNLGGVAHVKPESKIHYVTAKQTLKLSAIPQPQPKKKSTTTYWQSPSQAGNLFLSK